MQMTDYKIAKEMRRLAPDKTFNGHQNVIHRIRHNLNVTKKNYDLYEKAVKNLKRKAKSKH